MEYSKSAANAIEANGDNFSKFDDNGSLSTNMLRRGIGARRNL